MKLKIRELTVLSIELGFYWNDIEIGAKDWKEWRKRFEQVSVLRIDRIKHKSIN